MQCIAANGWIKTHCCFFLITIGKVFSQAIVCSGVQVFVKYLTFELNNNITNKDIKLYLDNEWTEINMRQEQKNGCQA